MSAESPIFTTTADGRNKEYTQRRSTAVDFSEGIEVNANEAEREQSERPQKKPWIVLIERFYENGAKTSSVTTIRANLDPSMETFLRKEAAKMTQRAERLKDSIREASEIKEHGRRRSPSKVRKIRKSLGKELGTVLEHKEVLLGNRRTPLKIKIIDGEIKGWDFPRGGDGLWAQYVGDENPQILEFPREDIAKLREAFVLRHAISLGAPDVKEKYYELLEQVRDRDDLVEYLVKFTKRFSRR